MRNKKYNIGINLSWLTWFLILAIQLTQGTDDMAAQAKGRGDEWFHGRIIEGRIIHQHRVKVNLN